MFFLHQLELGKLGMTYAVETPGFDRRRMSPKHAGYPVLNTIQAPPIPGKMTTPERAGRGFLSKWTRRTWIDIIDFSRV